MNDQIDTYKDDITQMSTESINNNRVASETNNQILALKAKHEEEKERFEIEIKKLQEKLKERDDPTEYDDKSFKNKESEAGPG
jgi:hypothetical protein